MSPITTDIYGTPHGRRTRPRGGKPPGVWITETNMDPVAAGGGFTDAQVERMQAKSTLRYLTAFVNKGVSALHFYAAKGQNLGLVEPAFFDALQRPGAPYPGDDAGGETPRAVRRLVAPLAGAAKLRKTRPLSLHAISDKHDHRQFAGDGSAARPPLYDRDVLAFLPFQLRKGDYVAAVYVMTRNIVRPRRRGNGPDRFDLPPARFRLTLGGLSAKGTRASATDPLTGADVPVKVVSRAGRRLIVELAATDSPRLLRLTEGRSRGGVSLKLKRRKLSRSGWVLSGRVRARKSSCRSKLLVTVSRWSAGARRWRRHARVRTKTVGRGRFSASVGRLSSGRYRAEARGRAGGCAASRPVSFRVG